MNDDERSRRAEGLLEERLRSRTTNGHTSPITATEEVPGNPANVTADAKDLFGKLQHIEEIKVVKKPRNLKAQLRPYQEQGYQWLSFLHELGSGGILAHDMGLGKTAQTIARRLSV